MSRSTVGQSSQSNPTFVIEFGRTKKKKKEKNEIAIHSEEAVANSKLGAKETAWDEHRNV